MPKLKDRSLTVAVLCWCGVGAARLWCGVAAARRRCGVGAARCWRVAAVAGCRCGVGAARCWCGVATATCVWVAVAVMCGWGIAAQPLYEQSVTRILHERFSSQELSYLLIDAGSGRVVDARWPGAEQPIAPGSLVKPFAALAWRERHERYLELVCHGQRDGCWYAAGHGRIGIVEAVAHSCNAYFVTLAREVRAEDAAVVARRFGIAAPTVGSAESLAGIGDGWRIAPADLARAYCALAREGGASELLAGMAISALRGTGRAVGSGRVKTGTAACGHLRRAAGDGYTLVLDAGFALLVQVHGVTGAEAAVTAGRMMRAVREGR